MDRALPGPELAAGLAFLAARAVRVASPAENVADGSRHARRLAKFTDIKQSFERGHPEATLSHRVDPTQKSRPRL